jgi:PBSX family phage terminase large subunit
MKKVIGKSEATILHPAQSIIAKSRHRFRVVNCGRRFGKTILAVYEMIGRAVAKGETHIAYVAPNFQQARDIAWLELRKIALPITEEANEARLELSVKTKDGGISTIKLRGYEAVESLRGQFFDLLVLDEVASMRNFWVGWEEVLRPTLTDRKGDAMFISTPKGFNHFYELYQKENEDEDYKSFHFTSYDNPHIPKEEIDKAKEELPEDKFSQEYLADFRKTEGLVYKEFDRTKHLFGEEIRDKEFVEILVGIDFGYSNPATVITIGVDSDRKYYVLEEWYKAKQTTEQIVEIAISTNGHKFYPDPAEPDRVKAMEDAGLRTMDVKKGRDSIVFGVDKIRELIKQNRFFVSRDCKNTILEFETYRYPDKKIGRNEQELPVKENDHALDAIRYVIMMHEPVTKNVNVDFNLYSNNYE